jgi:outer membrane lipoprotein
MKKSISLALAFIFLFSGCTHIISKNSLAMADRSIAFTQILENPDKYSGKFVILGGTVAGITYTPNGAVVEVQQLPLDSMELPDLTSVSQGRFMVDLPPGQASATLKPGMLVSMAGEVAGKMVRELKGEKYTYPLIVIKELHIMAHRSEGYYRGY